MQVGSLTEQVSVSAEASRVSTETRHHPATHRRPPDRGSAAQRTERDVPGHAGSGDGTERDQHQRRPQREPEQRHGQCPGGWSAQRR